jgi:hypothetical protein
MKCYFSHNLLCIYPFATNVHSSALLPQYCHHQRQTMLGILKSKARLPLRCNQLSDLYSVKSDRQLIVCLLFPVLGVFLTKWNVTNNHTHKLCGELCHCGRRNKPLCKNMKDSDQIGNEAV